MARRIAAFLLVALGIAAVQVRLLLDHLHNAWVTALDHRCQRKSPTSRKVIFCLCSTSSLFTPAQITSCCMYNLFEAHRLAWSSAHRIDSTDRCHVCSVYVQAQADFKGALEKNGFKLAAALFDIANLTKPLSKPGAVYTVLV